MEFVIGIICGVLLSLFFSLGPAFFALIQNSIHHGFRKAVSFAAGVSASDIIIVLLMLTVLSNLDLNALLHNVYVSIIGGVATGIFGVLTYRSKVKAAGNSEGRLKFSTEQVTHKWELMLKGFLLNALNPLIWLYWVSIITFLSAEMDLSVSERYYFFIGMLLAVFGTDVLKCRLAAMLQHWFTARIMNIFNKITGIILIAFSFYLVISMIIYQTKGADTTPQNMQKTGIVQKVHDLMRRDSNERADEKMDTAYITLLPDSMVSDSLVDSAVQVADSLPGGEWFQ
ncbi:MAG: LysE family transporter [Bacteroidales bacterium]|nr:LysE family transporter [Bacteroidales bacterium]